MANARPIVFPSDWQPFNCGHQCVAPELVLLDRDTNFARHQNHLNRAYHKCVVESNAFNGIYTSMPYSKRRDRRIAMEFYIACAPEDHPVIPGSGGFRKARWRNALAKFAARIKRAAKGR
jgi:hypothetical protein